MSHYTIDYTSIPLRRDRLVKAADDAKDYLGAKQFAAIIEELKASRPNRIDKKLVRSLLFQLRVFAGVQGVPGRAILHAAWSTHWPTATK